MGSKRLMASSTLDPESSSELSRSPQEARHGPRKSKNARLSNGIAFPEDDYDENEIKRELVRQERLAKDQKALKTDIEKHQDELANPSSSALDDYARKAETTFQEVHDIQAARKDVEIVRLLSASLAKQAANIGQSNQTLSKNVLSRSLLRSFLKAGTNDVVDFARIGEEVQVFFRPVPSFDSMLGAMDFQFAPKKERAKKVKNTEATVAAAKVGATQLKEEADDEGGQGMYKMHQDLLKELATKLKSEPKPVPVFNTVVDPKSFTQTVENIFALSFLVKDGTAWLTVEDEKPEVKLIKKEDKSEAKSDVQFVATFSYEDWQNVCEEYEIDQSKLHHRTFDVYDDVRQEEDDKE